ncbi:uncharacterized protein [Agelaius tricolor]|uniref:uncharacterized protein isoform X3 n=1 Tax=Agelaius tricolor TaxID=9191 RepID=UPI0039F24860
MGFVDGHKISGALKLSCRPLTFVRTFSFRCRRIKSRAEHPIPGEGIAPSRKSRQRAAVKAEWARWSTCNLSWLSMTMPGAVAALGTPRNREGQVSSGQPPESNQDLRLLAKAWKRQHQSTRGGHLNVQPTMAFVRLSSKS